MQVYIGYVQAALPLLILCVVLEKCLVNQLFILEQYFVEI